MLVNLVVFMEMSVGNKDCRMIIRLLAETASLEGGHAEKKRFLMRGIAELVDADAWVWTLGCDIEAGGRQTCVNFLHEGFLEHQFPAFLAALEDVEMGKIASTFYVQFAERGKHTSMCRQEIDPEGLAYQGRIGELWKAADLEANILSAYPLDRRSLSGVAVYRRFGRPLFTERDRQLLHLILTEIPWLHASGWPEDRGGEIPRLSPRERMVLNLLLDGKSRMEIATDLELSEHTVGDYVKAVYRFFGVNSHAELVHKFLAATDTS